MFDFFVKKRGSISVFISLILLPVLIFGCLIIDGTRILGSKSIVTGAGDLAMNAALTKYDFKLKDMYGLFGMEELNSSDLEKYFEYSINAAKFKGNGSYGGLISLDNDGFTISGVNQSEVCQPEVMRQQILEYSKYRAPLAMGEDILEKLNIIKDQKKAAKAVENQMEASKKIEEVNDICERLKLELENHNNYCQQKPSDADVRQKESQIAEYYRTISEMLMILSATTHGELEAASGDTEYKVRSFLQAMETVDASSEHPENHFGSIMAALKYSTSISSSDLTDMVNNAENADKKTELTQLKTQYESKVRVIESYKNKVSSIINQNISTVYSILNSWKQISSGAKSTGNTALSTLNEIKGMLEDDTSGLLTAMRNWQNSINAMSEGEQKTMQQQQYEKYAAVLDSSDINDMIGCVNDNITYFSKFEAWLESFEFCNVVLLNESDPYFTYTGQSERYYIHAPYTKNQVINEGTEFFNGHYTHWGYTDTMTGMLYHNLNEHPYFNKLKDLYQGTQNDTASNKTEQNLNSGKTSQDEAKSEVTGLQNADWSGTIPSVWLSEGGSDTASGDMTGLDTTSGSDKKKLASSGKKVMNSASSFLDGLSNIAEGSIENLYLAEYGIQMFSYYTIDKNRDGTDKNADDIVSLSGFKFCNDSTAMYKSEVEYLLWGSREAGNNVMYTKMTIFGIRFMMNCIYAFTDSELVGQAASLAACTNLAAPLVQTALLISAALVETAYDMEWLMNGKSVMIMKTKNTWHTSLFGNLTGKNSDNGNEALKLSYKEYLRIFLLINTIGDAKEDRLLARMADCMQFNLRKNSSSLDMTKSYTMISAKADVSVNTTFMGKIPQALNLADPGIGDRFQIHYKSVLAY